MTLQKVHAHDLEFKCAVGEIKSVYVKFFPEKVAVIHFKSLLFYCQIAAMATKTI